MTTWYTSGDGRDVASGDEYYHGYVVHARARDAKDAGDIAHALNAHAVLRFLSSATEAEAEKLAAVCGFMADLPEEDPDDRWLITISATGVSRGSEPGWIK